VKITPVAQVIPTYRSKDTGPWASGGVNDPGINPKDPTEVDSGYHRMLLSPGIEFDIHPVMIYADAEFDDLQWSKGKPVGGADPVQVGRELFVLRNFFAKTRT
jgi:hypothetical protein